MSHEPLPDRLLGAVGTALIPASWFGRGRWTASVVWAPGQSRASGRRKTERWTAHELVSTPVFAQSEKKRILDLASTATSVGESRAAAEPTWLRHEIGSPPRMERFPLGRLPLRKSTFRDLSQVGVTRESPLLDLERISRADLAQASSDGWVSLLDLEVALWNWLPAVEAGRAMDPWATSTASAYGVALSVEILRMWGRPADDPWGPALRRRLGWDRRHPAVLKEVGDLMGVGRERVRQIMNGLERTSSPIRWPMPDSVRIELASRLAEGEGTWHQDAVIAMAHWSGDEELKTLLGERLMERATDQAKAKEVADRSRSLRSKLGFVDLVLVEHELGVSAEVARAGVLAAYPRSVFSDGWALARTVRQTSMAESTAGEQLGIAQPLDAEELCEGLERRRSFHGTGHNPPCETALSLLAMAGAVSIADGRVTGKRLHPRKGTVQQWLVEVLRSEPVLHRNQLTERATAAGINGSTLSVHLSFDPVIRMERLGIYRLVGGRPSDAAIQAAQKRGRALSTPSRVVLRSEAGALQLNIAFGSLVMSSGVLYAPSSVAGIWPPAGLAVRCSCGHLTSQRIKRAKNNLYGWNSFLRHARSAHPQLDLRAVVLRIGTKELQVK